MDPTGSEGSPGRILPRPQRLGELKRWRKADPPVRRFAFQSADSFATGADRSVRFTIAHSLDLSACPSPPLVSSLLREFRGAPG